MKAGFYQLSLSVILLSAAVLALAACGGGDRPKEPPELTIPIKVERGSLHPETVRVTQGDMVTLAIESDSTGQFHLHGYDLEKEVTAGETTDFFFTAEATGRYRITIHYSGSKEGSQGGEEQAGGDHHGEGQGKEDTEEGDHHEEGKEEESSGDNAQDGETNLGYLEVSPP